MGGGGVSKKILLNDEFLNIFHLNALVPGSLDDIFVDKVAKARGKSDYSQNPKWILFKRLPWWKWCPNETAFEIRQSLRRDTKRECADVWREM